MEFKNYEDELKASDMRLKTNVTPIANALDKVKSLSTFTYNLNAVAESIGFRSIEEKHLGLSAQELLEVAPESVGKLPANNDYYAVKYDRLVVLLIAAVKEQQQIIDDLKLQIQNLST